MFEQQSPRRPVRNRLLARSKRERLGLWFLSGIFGVVPVIAAKAYVGKYAGEATFGVWLVFMIVFASRFFGVHPEQQHKSTSAVSLGD